jgi:flagellar biogenesis protein FliO
MDQLGELSLIFRVLGFLGILACLSYILTKFLNKRDKFRSVTQGKNGITLCDTRSLGNRQFLVVAEYDQQKFLLGVSTGNIKLLSKLDSRVLPVGSSSKKNDS